MIKLKWTKEKPIEEGWYFYRKRELIDRIIIGVGLLRIWHSGKLIFQEHGTLEIGSVEINGFEGANTDDYEWAGPIEEPE